MRALTIILLAIAAALLGETQAGNAQSPYSYPWCAIMSGGDNSGGGAMSCYYSKRSTPARLPADAEGNRTNEKQTTTR